MGLGAQRRTAGGDGGGGLHRLALVDRLLAEGFEVVGLDNLMTGDHQPRRRRAGSRIFTSRRPTPASRSTPTGDPLQFACPASPFHYQADPHATFTTSVLGALRLVELARGRPCTIVHASTSEVLAIPR
jgi:UDP-glucuronate decarboxylase